jgi:asparagine synthase (glutamine-hydrolysing)
MCGIAGIHGNGLPTIDGAGTLAEMLRLIRHRGPNEAGVYLSDKLCMGTMRLSIVGIATGQQPVHDENEHYFLCYNGEIYNFIELKGELEALGYRFATESDTEVVLHAWRAWGAQSLQRFNGAFAFALYDRRQEVLYLARDRFGKRPLFYTRHGSEWLFSSEMKSFLAVKNFTFEFDRRQLASILALWTPIGDQTSYQGVLQVPQGAYVKLAVGRSEAEVHRYYHLDFTSTCNVGSEAEAIEMVRHTLHRAVELRLRSDVEVGMYLSGGLDSSILAVTLAEQVAGRFKTYSVSFEDLEFDESPDQQRMVAHVGSQHRTLRITDRMLVEHFPIASFHAEIPVFRTAFVPMYLLSSVVRDDGIKVVITGEGADEAFLGYDLFKETLLRQAWNELDDASKLRGLQRLYPYLRHYNELDAASLMGLYQQFSQEQHAGLFSHELRIQNGLFSRRLLKDQSGSFDAIQALLGQHGYFAGLTAVQKAQWLEYQSLLSGYLLSSQGDRMALANSVENRCPFLDPGVVDIAAAVNLKFDDGTDEKYLLRKAFAGQLPPQIANKRKYPYRAPDRNAFARHRPDYLELLLSDAELSKNELLNPAFCRLLTKKILDPSVPEVSTKENQTFIFLLSLALQHRYFIKRDVSPVASHPAVDDIMVKVVDRRQSSRRGELRPADKRIYA